MVKPVWTQEETRIRLRRTSVILTGPEGDHHMPHDVASRMRD
jgi:hypothetical protein